MRTPFGSTRHALAALVALAAAVTWTHALAGGLRALAGVAVDELAPAGLALTFAAVAATLLGGLAGRRAGAARAAAVAGSAGSLGAFVTSAMYPGTLIPALALVPAVAGAGALGAWLARKLPSEMDAERARHPKRTWAFLALGLLAVLQLGRLATHVTDAEVSWFLSTSHPFYAAHECANAYVFAAELSERGEPDVYDPAHYPGLNPAATPETEVAGLSPEDPFQYPPHFLLLPRLALELTRDYHAIRAVWFGLNVTLCLGAVLLLAGWVGGRAGRAAAIWAPLVLFSFPVLHDFQYGQFHFAAVALAVLGLVAVQRDRAALGGSLLAAAVLSKLFPAVLLVPLAIQRRWKALGWTAGTGAALTLVALGVLGTAPFAAFGEHLGRLADGSAFAFGEAWPEVADLVVAGNQGVHGIVHKLSALGWLPDASLAPAASRLFGMVLLLVAIAVGRSGRGASRREHAAMWLGLLGLGSLASAGAWADYVPLTGVWAITYLAPSTAGRPALQVALACSAVFQVFLIGTMPIGEAADPSWMTPLSLAGALALFATLASAALVRARAVRAVLDGSTEHARAAAGSRNPA